MPGKFVGTPNDAATSALTKKDETQTNAPALQKTQNGVKVEKLVFLRFLMDSRMTVTDLHAPSGPISGDLETRKRNTY